MCPLLRPLLALCSSALLLPAQDGIRIVRVPDALVLPAAAGRNLLLEVEVNGAPRSVWLAAGAGAESQAPLAAAGGGRWQINLADVRVAALLRRAAEDRLFVFADVNGHRLESAPIAFERAAVPPPKLACTAHLAKAAQPVTVSSFAGRRLAPAAVERFEVAGIAPPALVAARMGSTDCPFTYVPDRRVFALTLDDGVRNAWLAAGTLEIEVNDAGALTVPFACDAVPARLALEGGKAEFALVQRKRAYVPGSRDWLRVHIDDITAGQVMLDLRTADGDSVVAPRSLHAREHVEFELAGGRYVLVVRKLVNLLIGDDFAELEVLPAEHFAADRIAGLLQRVAGADAVFLRAGQEYTSLQAAGLMRQRLDTFGREPTVAEFVEVASRSSTSGEPYQVRTPDGRTVTAREWLEQELAAMERDARAAKPAAGR